MLKRISIYAAVIAAGGLMYAPIIANAKEGGHQRPTFEELDADNDGQITKAELAARGDARFAEIDTDGDGFVSQTEIEAMQAERAKKRAERMLNRLDADNDGKLSLAEMQSTDRGTRMFNRVDADKDGVISKAEFDAIKDRRQGHRKP